MHLKLSPASPETIFNTENWPNRAKKGIRLLPATWAVSAEILWCYLSSRAFFLWLVLSTGKHFFLNTFYVSSYWIYFFLFKIKMACLSHPFRYKRIMEIPNIIVISSRSEKKIWHSVRFKFWIWAILELQFNSTYNKHIGYAVRVTKFQNFFVSPPLLDVSPYCTFHKYVDFL